MAKHIPERMCVGCRKMKPKPDLIKVVLNNGIVEADFKSNKFGRGAYFCRNIECIEAAKKKKALSRQFKTAVPESFYESVKEFLHG